MEVQPTLASSHLALGTAYLVLVQDQQRRGVDPRQALEQAATSYQRAIALDPGFVLAYTNLGNTWKSMAEVQVARGADPSDSVGRAVAAFQQAAHLNPTMPRCTTIWATST